MCKIGKSFLCHLKSNEINLMKHHTATTSHFIQISNWIIFVYESTNVENVVGDILMLFMYVLKISWEY